MVEIDLTVFPKFPSDVEFSQELLDEQQLFVLPGSCFTMPSFFRVVLCAPESAMTESVARIAAFCDTHRVIKK
jgi:tyrosine aminotransferase